MRPHWTSRLAIGITGAGMLWANLDAFGVFTMRIKDGRLLWLTKVPKHVKRFNNHNTGLYELGFVSGKQKDWMRNTETRVMFQVPNGHVCVEALPGSAAEQMFKSTDQDFDNYKWNVVTESSVKGVCSYVGLPPSCLPPLLEGDRRFVQLS